MMTEIVGQAQNTRHITTAHFGRRFSNLAIELSGFFDDEHACLGPFAFQDKRRRGAGKRAANDHDVVFEIHRSRRMDFTASKRNCLCLALKLKRSRLSVRPNDLHKRAFNFSGWNSR